MIPLKNHSLARTSRPCVATRGFYGSVRVAALLALALALPMLGGCPGVITDAAHAGLIDNTTALFDEAADRGAAGKLSPADYQGVIIRGQTTMHLLQDAKNGKASATPTPTPTILPSTPPSTPTPTPSSTPAPSPTPTSP